MTALRSEEPCKEGRRDEGASEAKSARQKGGTTVIYFWAFVVGGLICAVMQWIYLKFPRLTPGHLLVGLTVVGAIVNGFGLYDRLVEFAGAGALLPVSGFGASITRGVMEEMQRLGWEGVLTGTLELVGLGIAAGVLFSTLAALASAPRD